MALKLNPMGLVLSEVLARREGVEGRDLMRISLLGSMFNPPVLGAIMAQMMARREAASAPGTTKTQAATNP